MLKDLLAIIVGILLSLHLVSTIALAEEASEHRYIAGGNPYTITELCKPWIKQCPNEENEEGHNAKAV